MPELAERDATVTELTAPLAISMPAVSRHLKVLERAALISRSQSGKWRASHLEAAPLREAADWIERYRRFWDSSLTRLDAHLAAVQAAGPELRVHIHVDLTDVADGELLEGVMHVSGRLQEGIEPFETRLRVEFHDEADGRTRLEIRQWLPEHLAHDDEVFAFTTDLLRSAGTFLYGRRLYEAMAVWETNAALATQSDLMADFASTWQAANKVVYSTTLAAVPTADTRLERHFDPAAVHQLKATASSDLTVGGANLAAQAFKAGLVDECQLFIWPIVVGGGKPGLPTGIRADLELLDERRFRNGVVHLRYRPLGQ